MRPGGLTNAARLGDLIEGLQQVPAQLLDIVEVVKHRVGEVHEVVQVNGVALGSPESHIEGGSLPCMSEGSKGHPEPGCGPHPVPQIPIASPISYDLEGVVTRTQDREISTQISGLIPGTRMPGWWRVSVPCRFTSWKPKYLDNGARSS